MMVSQAIALLPAFLCPLSDLAQQPPASPEVGDPPPAITLQQLLQAPEGSLASWEALRGKVVVLEFWATWCANVMLWSCPEASHLAATRSA